MRRALSAALGAFAAAAVAEPAGAEPWRLRLDPEATTVRIAVGATLHTVRGRFDVERGRVRFDPDTGAASGEVVVDARSGDTGIAERDRNMHEQVLASGAHPRIVLRPRRLEDVRIEAEELRAVLEAELVLRGEAHPVRFPVRATREEGRGIVEGAFEVPYVAWGLPDPDTFLLRVDDVVRVTFRAEGALDASTAAGEARSDPRSR